jgi:hypothetical protein
MNSRNRSIVLSVLFLALTAGIAHAQLNSPVSAVQLQWNDPENLFINVMNGGFQNFQQPGGALTPTTNPITVNANYNQLVNRTSLTIYAYFADAARALTDTNGGSSITAANIQANITAGTIGTVVFNTPSPFSPASVTLATSPITSASSGMTPVTATFSLGILGTNYAAGTYSGTLFIQAQVL